MRPGMMVLPVASTRSTPAGILTFGPTAAILPLRTRRIALSMAGLPVPSMSRAPTKARSAAAQESAHQRSKLIFIGYHYFMSRRVWLGLAALCAATLWGAPRDLEMYWIDAEGGAATLIVAPSGDSLLV